MNIVTTQELVEFSMKQEAAAELKAFINKRYELSLDPTNRVDAEPIIQEMLENYGQ